MTDNPLWRLNAAGQSIWLDYIDRTMLRNGDLQRRIRDDALTGMTSNPTIFEKALAEGTAYDDQIRGATGDRTALELFELIATTDVRDACDAFQGVHERTGGNDGFVSIEVSPGAANDAVATISEATRLWATVDRPNVMVKVPGTAEGAKAVRQLIANGININITLLFSIAAYKAVIDAYIGGLEDRVAAGKDISKLHSVASFFVSRVDTEVDKRLDAAIKAAPDKQQALVRAQGQGGDRERQAGLQAVSDGDGERRDGRRSPRKGANVQRPLWASTSTKNPAYRDVMYVEELIGPDTVNTMPPQTIEAFRDHGVVARTVDADVDEAQRDDRRARAERHLDARRDRQVARRRTRQLREVVRDAHRRPSGEDEGARQRAGGALIASPDERLHDTTLLRYCRTKVVCTLGPSSASREALRSLVEAGMNVARINFSHSTHEQHAATIALVREVAEETGRPIAILGDLQGPRIRIGDLADADRARRRQRRRARAGGDGQGRRDSGHVRAARLKTCTSATAC